MPSEQISRALTSDPRMPTTSVTLCSNQGNQPENSGIGS